MRYDLTDLTILHSLMISSDEIERLTNLAKSGDL